MKTAQMLGAHLRSLRTEKGLTQKALAPKLAADNTVVSRLEKGENWTVERIDLAAAAFGTDGPGFFLAAWRRAGFP